jgi:hypothetical protein
MLRPLVVRTLARVAPLIALGAAIAVAACGESGTEHAAAGGASDIPAFDTISLLALPDSASSANSAPAAPRRKLSALADSVGREVTFLATFQGAFVAAARNGQLLVDIGRIDAKLGTPELLHAFREAAAARAPLSIGDSLRLRGPWGENDAVVTGYGEWKGRAVATIDAPPLVDSLARHSDPLVALALRTDSAAAPVADSCDRRGKLPGRVATRASAVGDSLVAALRSDTVGRVATGGRPPASRVTRVAGCFGDGQVMIFADIGATAHDPAREVAVLLGPKGDVTPLTVNDLRFKTHEALRAFDADGDGVDDVAALGRADRSGGTVVLHFDPDKRRLTYIMSGFAWESF